MSIRQFIFIQRVFSNQDFLNQNRSVMFNFTPCIFYENMKKIKQLAPKSNSHYHQSLTNHVTFLAAS